MPQARYGTIGGTSLYASGATAAAGFVGASPPPAGPRLVGRTRQGIISNYSLSVYIVFQKNPETVTEETQDTYTFTTIQGQANPLMSFSGRGAKHKRFDILIDAHATPHALGHIGEDLDAIEMLTIPHDNAGLPLVIPARRGVLLSNSGIQSRQPQGTPPVVKIAHGSRVQKGFIVNLSIEEIMHGTTPQSEALCLPTRAKVSFDFVIIDDMRMLVSVPEVVA